MTAGHASASTQMCMAGVRPRFFLVFALRGSDPDFQAAFLTTSRTFMPARLAMVTSASRLNWPIFPLSSALRRGCVRPSAFAPAACVMPLFRWNSTMRIIRSDRIFRFSASTLSNPRSMKMLPLPRTHLSFPVIAGSLRRSGNQHFELLQVALGDAPLEVEHLDADNLLLGVKVQHDARLHLLGLDNLRVVQAKVKPIGLRVVVDSHVLPRCRRSK